MAHGSTKIGGNSELAVDTPEVLQGFERLDRIADLAAQLDRELFQLSENPVFRSSQVQVSNMAATANCLCGYITSDDLSIEVESYRESDRFRTAVAVAVYSEETDSWVPQYESETVLSNPEASLTYCLEVVCGVRSRVETAGGIGTIADFIEAVLRSTN